MIGSAFSQFSLPEISTVARRTVLAASILGVVALVGTTVLSHGLIGLGICIGLVLALGNFRLITRATIKQASLAKENTRRPLALNTLGRLGLITAAAFGLVWVSYQLGLGAIVGLALFQFMLLSNVIFSMLRSGQAASASSDEGASQ